MNRLRAVARRLRVERPAVAVRRRFLPARIRADIRDYELMVTLLERVLEPDSDCLDIGASEGLLLREMVRIAPRGRHVAWEPLPEFAARLRKEFPSVMVREAALGAMSGEVDFHHALDEPGWSGLQARPTPRRSRFQTIRVAVERLDDGLPGDVRPRVVKIDVEGAEEGVLRGGFDVITTHRPLILLEHAVDAAHLYGTLPEQLHDALGNEFGYELFGLDGDGPYDSAGFAGIVRAGERYNFAGWPRGSPRAFP